MMKKKFKEKEENHQEDIDKQTENKENSNPELINEEELELPAAGDSDEPSPEIEYENGPASDKEVPEARAIVEKLAEMQDKYIRLSAEFDNYRRRTLREKMELSKYATEDLLAKIIPLMDDFERAQSHLESAKDCVALKNGIDLIYSKFSEFLKQNGISEIESLNADFNVDLHEAVAKVPVTGEEKKGKVVDVLQKGYYLRDKVIRFAKVVVGE
jgi:molecular chaperone GrpE